MRAPPVPTREFALRLCLACILAGVAHQFQWIQLRLLTSQLVLILSGMLGMGAERAAFDTIAVQGHAIQFTVACTFVEAMLGMQPLIWRIGMSLSRNLMRMFISMILLFACNILRIEAAQILFGMGVSWTLAHDVPLGFLYFAAWVVVWRTRTWRALHDATARYAPISNESA